MCNGEFQSYSGNIYDCTPKKLISREEFIRQQSDPRLVSLFDKIAAADKAGNEKLKGELKKTLKKYTPSVVIGNYQKGKSNYPNKVWKDYAHIIHFTGMIVLDFDHLREINVDAQKLKKALFHEYKSCIASWISPSKNGVKALFSISDNIHSVEEFKSHYRALEQEFKGIGLDESCKSPILFVFQTYDPYILFRDNAERWIKTISETPKEKKAKVKQKRLVQDYEPLSYGNIEEQTRNIQLIADDIERGFKNITALTGGFPKLRKLAYHVGGLVEKGYLDEKLAVSIFHHHIENHPYLKEKQDIYKNTAYITIQDGREKPVAL